MRGNYEIVEVLRAGALLNGGTARFSKEFPMGEGWRRLLLHVHHGITAGSESGAISEGELRLIKGVTFKTDRGEVLYNSVPGRPLFRLDAFKQGTIAPKNAMATGTATLSALFSVWFEDPLMEHPADTVLDTSRYSSVTLEIQYGTIADCFTTVGTAVLAGTVDIYLERQRGPVPAKIKPKFFHEVGVRGPLNPASQTYIELERAANLAYKRVLAVACNSVTAGVPFDGTLADTTLLDVGVDHDGGRAVDAALVAFLAGQNKSDYKLETALVGQYLLDFTKDKSLNSAIYSGNKSRLRVYWNNGTLSTSGVTLCYEAVRPTR